MTYSSRSLLILTGIAVLAGCSDGGSSRGMSPDLPPEISAVGDLEISANSQAVEVSFSIGDDQTAAANLTVTVADDASGLFGDAGLMLEGAGEQRRLLLTPVAARTGTAEIVLTVTDGAAQSSDTRFRVTVVPQSVVFSDAVRSAFAAAADELPLSLNDKEFDADASDFSDLLGN